MKTIKDVLCELDASEIEKAYFERYPIKLHDITKKLNLSIGDVQAEYSDRFQKFLSALKEHAIEPDDEYILFCSMSVVTEWNTSNHTTWLCRQDELLQADSLDKVQTYAYEYSTWGEMVGFLVADTVYTQEHLMDVVVDFLFEASYLGYDEESHNKKIDWLKNLKATGSTHELLEFEDTCELDLIVEDEKMSAYNMAVNDYIKYFKCEEMRQIREKLISK